MTTAKGDPPAVLRRTYEGTLSTLRTARRDVVDWLADLSADQETCDRAALIISELTSNAIQASPGSSYQLEVARVGDDLATISVRNRPTRGLPPPREQWRPAPSQTLRQLPLRGRGLAIVDSLSEDLAIEQQGDELLVTARVRLQIV